MPEATTRPDRELVLEFCRGSSQAAFAELVRRHGGLVHASCRRMLGANHPQLDDACQAVFLILVKKAGSMRNPSGLVAWLHQTACFVAGQILRTERRRRRRELVAARQPVATESEDAESAVAEHLDDALAELSTRQREVVLRHYLEGKSHASVAAELGLSEGVVKKRAADAMAKLREFFSRRAVISASALALALTAEASAAPPAVFSTFIATGVGSATALNLTTGVLKTMFMKTVLAFATASALIVGSGTIAAIAVRAAESPNKKPAKEAAVAIPKWVPTTLWQWTDIPGSTPAQYMKNDGSGILPKAWSIGGQGGENYSAQQANGGPCWSDKNKELWFAGQGGHKASLMNPVVKARLAQESPDWVALDPGSTYETVLKEWEAGAAWMNSPYLSDGRKKSDHSYRDTQYMDVIDEVLCVGIQAAGAPIVDVAGWDEIAGWPRDGKAWRPRGYWGSVPRPEGHAMGVEECICQSFDGTGIYTTHGYGGGPLHFFDVKTKEWKSIGPGTGGADHYMRMAENSSGTILQTKNHGDENDKPLTLYFIDTKTGIASQVTTSGAPLLDRSALAGRDIVYATANDKWYIGFNSSLYEVTKTGPTSASVTVVATTGTGVTNPESRRGLYYCTDWKCIIGYDGFDRPLKIIRVAK